MDEALTVGHAGADRHADPEPPLLEREESDDGRPLGEVCESIAFVYEQACTGCEKCVERCPFEALEMVPVNDPNSFLGIVSVIEKNCVGCRECEKACPYDAIFIYRKDTVPEWLKNSKVERAA